MPPRRSRKGLWIALGIVLLVVIIIGAAASASKGSGTSNSPQPTQAANVGSTPTQASQPTTAPTSANAGTHKVGEPVTLGGWTVTVNSVKTSQGGQFDSLKAGDVFLEVDVSVVNNTGQTQPFSSIISFTLKDQNGQKYDETIASDAPSTPDGNVANGSKLKGTVVYEVPKATKSFEFDFTPDITSTDLATWSLTV